MSGSDDILGSVSTHAGTPVIIGRAQELDRLSAAFSMAPGAVLIGGEAGVGKTRLINEFVGRVRRDARVLVGGCLELGSDGLPFAPFTAALRQLVREIGIDRVAELLPGATAAGLARLLPEFGEPEGESTSGEVRARLFELVLTLLERLAESSPLVLVIEDAHWADRSTRDLLSFLIRNLGGKVFILVTYRLDELHRTHPLRPLLAELDRVDRVQRQELGRLSRREVAELAQDLLKREPEPRLIDKVYRRSEGNPLFVEALIGCDGQLAGELPESLRDLLLANMQKLPEDTQELLRMASGGGAHIEHALLAAVSGYDDTTLTRLLRPAVAANVIIVEGDGYCFRHALIREAVHDDLLPGEHTRLHTRYAEALEQDPELVPSGRAAVELAHHWHSAHNVTWALISAWRAALAALKAAAHSEALSMLSRVLELWDRVPDAAARIGHDQTQVLEKAVMAADLAGESERGIKLATAALKQVDDPERAACLLEQRGRLSLQLRRPEGIADLHEAIRLVPAEPPTTGRARALATMAEQLFKMLGKGEARAAAEEAVAMARQVGDPLAEASGLLTLLCLDGGIIDVDESLAQLDRIEPIAEGAAAFRPVLRVAVNRSHVLEGAGRHEEATKVARRGVEQAGRFGLSRVSGTILAINLAEPLVSLGRWDEALTVIEQAQEQDPPLSHRAALQELAGEIWVARGDLPAAAAALEAASSLTARDATRRSEDLFAVIRLEAVLLLGQGRPELVPAAVEPVVADARLSDDARYAWPVLVLAAKACLAIGDERTLAAVRARAGKLPVLGPLQRAHQLTFDATVAPAGVADPAAWDTAAAAWESLSQPYARARALMGAATAALASGDREGAGVRLRRAGELAERLSARPLYETISDLSRRAGLTTGEPTSLGLTPRELEVLRLVTEGRSNRDIAAVLFISAKTASVHVSHILAKLGVAGRGEAAATAHRLGLFDRVPAGPRPAP
ncbi:MAG: transcriptional regulator, LuxR family [Streptosporangiaceae bacterium]|jgi:ATP/maltotriose-dependent transcriptional regulator MalT|nr:transcriptional regulator, LuxR family [Streptosporangiaceae bacterium]